MALGAFADRVKSNIPDSYQALVNASYYGESLIQERIDDIKYKFFATTVAFASEASIYDRYVLRYVGKVCTLELIPSAVDYWMNQIDSETTTGTNEQITFPDRLSALEKTYARLAAEVEDEREEFEAAVGTEIRLTTALPGVDTSSDDLVTSDPALFPKTYLDVTDVPPPWGITRLNN